MNVGYIYLLVTQTKDLTKIMGAFFNETSRYKELIEKFNCGLWPIVISKF